MPFQVMVQDRSGENLARGIEGFGQGMARMLDTLSRKKEQDKQEAKLTVSLRKTLKDLDASQALSEGREANPHIFDNMGPDEVRGTMRGIMVKSQLDKDAAALSHYKRMNATADREADRAKAFPGFVRAMGQLAQAPESVPSPLGNEEFDRRTAPVTPQSVMRTMGETGYDPGAQNFDDIMRAFTPKQTGWNLGPNQEFDLGGGRRGVAVSPNSMQVIPPEKANVQPGEGPRKSKDGKFFWDEKNQQWKPIHEGSFEETLQRVLGGPAAGGAPAVPGAAPTLRYRKGANGEVEQY